jgi:Ca-activated chloride channel homolog
MKALSKSVLVVGIGVIVIALSVGFNSFAQTQQPAPPKPAQQSQQTPPKTTPKPDPKAPVQKEEEEQILKVGTRLVNVLFTVNEKTGRYVNDLKLEDVNIFEDGKPQQIFTFKKEFDLALTMAIMVDVSRSEQYILPQLKDAGAHFVESVIRSGKDTVAVIKFEGEATLLQNLTSNKNRIRKGLEEISYIETSTPIGVYGGATPGINGNSRAGGTSIFDSVIATCSDLLAKEAGRKTIVLLTDGVDTTSRMKLNDAITEALKAEVVIYAIGVGDPASGGTFMGSGVDEGMLRKLTEATGGRVVFPSGRRDLDSAFAQLETDMRQQYLLAYEPSNETPDGSFRKLEIKVPKFKEKEIKIRHRRGYYAPKG